VLQCLKVCPRNGVSCEARRVGQPGGAMDAKAALKLLEVPLWGEIQGVRPLSPARLRAEAKPRRCSPPFRAPRDRRKGGACLPISPIMPSCHRAHLKSIDQNVFCPHGWK